MNIYMSAATHRIDDDLMRKSGQHEKHTLQEDNTGETPLLFFSTAKTYLSIRAFCYSTGIRQGKRGVLGAMVRPSHVQREWCAVLALY